jgi:hypothetical protein
MTHSGTGTYTGGYSVPSTASETDVVVTFNYTKNTVAYQQIRTSQIALYQNELQTLLSRLTATRAGYLDNLVDLDATVSSRATQVSVNAIPTDPLLTNDTRLNNLVNLDAPVSAVQTAAVALTQYDAVIASFGAFATAAEVTAAQVALAADIMATQSNIDSNITALQNAVQSAGTDTVVGYVEEVVDESVIGIVE